MYASVPTILGSTLRKRRRPGWLLHDAASCRSRVRSAPRSPVPGQREDHADSPRRVPHGSFSSGRRRGPCRLLALERPGGRVQPRDRTSRSQLPAGPASSTRLVSTTLRMLPPPLSPRPPRPRFSTSTKSLCTYADENGRRREGMPHEGVRTRAAAALDRARVRRPAPRRSWRAAVGSRSSNTARRHGPYAVLPLEGPAPWIGAPGKRCSWRRQRQRDRGDGQRRQEHVQLLESTGISCVTRRTWAAVGCAHRCSP